MHHRASWTIPTLIDFECLLAADAGADEEHLRTRDREIFQQKIQPLEKPGAARSRPAIFRAWLAARSSESGQPLPGEQIAMGWQTVVLLAAVAGLMMGGSLTAAMLHYKGAEPVNVSWFLVCTVGIQMLIFLAAIIFWIVRETTNLLDDFFPLRWAISGLVWAFSAGLRQLPGEQRERVRRTLAVMSRKREIYGSLAVWPALIVTQMFAVGFNVGILLALLLHVAFTDLDFGWQSTFVSSPATVHGIAWFFSIPWHWFPSSYPSLTDVIGSHFEYNEGLRKLSKHALKSWWPFLVYTVAFYGLLVRGSLLVWAGVKLRKSLGGLTFDHEGCNALFRRLTGPTVISQQGTAVLEIPAETAATPLVDVQPGDCAALLAADSDITEEDLAEYAKTKFGWRLGQTLAARIDHPSGNAAVLETLQKSAPGLAGVLVVARSRRSPIKAIAIFLQKVTTASGTGPETVLLLLGKKDGDQRARVPDDEFEHWQNLRALNKLQLTLERWTPS